ncbi:30S ribosomal protein S17 [Candidatus Peregrinibacteria bacterium]|nr:30S ribosomal protein S17 [Candidatus Peregrinibacteria bacterium]
MRTKHGVVVASKMEKTVVVRVDSKRAHPKYKKLVRSSKKFYAYDEDKKYRVGDEVTIYETRPLSRLKRWTVKAPSV